MSENVAASAGLATTDQIHSRTQITKLPRHFGAFDLANALVIVAITSLGSRASPGRR